jgi:hypothetical protein
LVVHVEFPVRATTGEADTVAAMMEATVMIDLVSILVVVILVGVLRLKD